MLRVEGVEVVSRMVLVVEIGHLCTYPVTYDDPKMSNLKTRSARKEDLSSRYK